MLDWRRSGAPLEFAGMRPTAGRRVYRHDLSRYCRKRWQVLRAGVSPVLKSGRTRPDLEN